MTGSQIQPGDTAHSNCPTARSCFPSAELQKAQHMILPVHCKHGWLTAPKAAANQPVFTFAMVRRHTHSWLPCLDWWENALTTQWFSAVGLQRTWRSLLVSHVPLSQVVRWFERNVRVDLQTLLAVLRAYPPTVSSWLLTSWKEKRQAEGAIKANSPAANGSSHVPGHSSPQAPLRQNVKAMY